MRERGSHHDLAFSFLRGICEWHYRYLDTKTGQWPSTCSLKHEINIKKEQKEDGLGKSASQTKVPHTLYEGTDK
jgi:hypothetical protein